MSGFRLLACALLSGAAFVGFVSPAAAVQHELSSTVSVSLQPTDWSAPLTFQRFDPDVGILLGVRFTMVGQAQGSASIESLNGSPSTVLTSFQAEVCLLRPDQSLLLSTNPLASFSDDLTTFDGVIDFGGKSGQTHAGIVATDEGKASAPRDSPDILLFTGNSGNPGTIDLTVMATGGSSANGSGNLITQFQTSASAEVTITYVYDLDCNANLIPDLEDIVRGTSNDVTPDRIPDECQPAAIPFCVGHGWALGGLDCPCGNEGNQGEGCDNGTGRGGLLTAAGLPSVSADTLSLTATQVPPTSPGFFVHSPQRVAGGGATVFGNGLLCLDFATIVAKSDGGGTIPFSGMPPLSFLLGIEAGDTRYFQYWYRNTTGPCPGQTVNAANAIAVTYGF